MKSRIAEELKLKYKPVAIIFADARPEGATEFKEGAWGCVIAMLSAAARGKTCVFTRETCGCNGGKIGLGFIDDFGGMDSAGGIEYFLSTGKGEGYPEGEGYKKTPELARSFVESLPRTLIPTKYVVFKPLEELDPVRETPQIVVMLASPDQLSALGVLANYGRAGMDAVISPFGAGCHTICLIPYEESKKDQPRAVIGCMDISARRFLDSDILAFSVPFAMYQEMEANVPGSFLEKGDWAKVRERIGN
jgi:uncharacterized protein (DUF169 family)